MPEKHFYFSLGAVVGSGICVVLAKKRHALRKTSALVQWLYRKEPNWFLYFPVVIFVVGLWGLIPDVIHFFGWLSKEQTRSAIFDVFFFHSTFEHIENVSPSIDHYLNAIGQFFLIAVSIGVMLFYVRKIKKSAFDYEQRVIANNQRK